MKKGVLIGLFILFTLGVCNSQNYIGKHKDEIKKMMREAKPEFKLDKTMVNQVYNYLKYIDDFEEQTFLFFMDENDKCSFTKLMCDYSLLNDVTDSFNKKYLLTDKNEWMYSVEGEKFIVKLTEEEWFFTVVTKKHN